MQKQHDVAEATNDYAPEVGASEAWDKFLNLSIQGKLDMNTTTAPVASQVQSGVAQIESLEGIIDQLEKVSTMASMIARLSEDRDVRGMAAHIRQMLGGLLNDADVLRMDIESGLAA
ncbi:hypothetical protein K5M36_16625 [Chromobacterium vaccinii]|nr:hypothetical protein [Chromobacterium vaccinii]